jgi:malate dehydrogenase (oxaloacetate-decarboxylating)(NADP+)
VHIDVGTETKSLIDDPAYMGLRQPRVRGQAYDDLLKEFFDACQDAYGRNVLIQV